MSLILVNNPAMRRGEQYVVSALVVDSAGTPTAPDAALKLRMYLAGSSEIIINTDMTEREGETGAYYYGFGTANLVLGQLYYIHVQGEISAVAVAGAQAIRLLDETRLNFIYDKATQQEVVSRANFGPNIKAEQIKEPYGNSQSGARPGGL